MSGGTKDTMGKKSRRRTNSHNNKKKDAVDGGDATTGEINV